MDPMGVNIIGANTTLSCLDFHRRFDATRKLGMKYIGFGARRDYNFFNYYDTSESSLHVDEGKQLNSSGRTSPNNINGVML